jgi:hypothetical protein
MRQPPELFSAYLGLPDLSPHPAIPWSHHCALHHHGYLNRFVALPELALEARESIRPTTGRNLGAPALGGINHQFVQNVTQDLGARNEPILGGLLGVDSLRQRSHTLEGVLGGLRDLLEGPLGPFKSILFCRTRELLAPRGGSSHWLEVAEQRTSDERGTPDDRPSCAPG